MYIDYFINLFAILITCIWPAFSCLPIMLDLVLYTLPWSSVLQLRLIIRESLLNRGPLHRVVLHSMLILSYKINVCSRNLSSHFFNRYVEPIKGNKVIYNLQKQICLKEGFFPGLYSLVSEKFAFEYLSLKIGLINYFFFATCSLNFLSNWCFKFLIIAL